MNTATATAELTAGTCATCEGTGEDLAFGGRCTDCQGATAPTRAPIIIRPDENAVGALADWLGEQKWSDFAQSLSRFYVSKGYLSDKQIAAGEKMRAKCEARQADRPKAPEGDPVKAEGMFRRASDGTVYRVQRSRTSGNLYAKRLTESGFEYDGGAIRTLTEADRMSLEEARAYGKATGTCCVCAAELTNPDSIEAGIGPICASKGWW